MITDTGAQIFVLMGALAFYGLIGWGLWSLRKRRAKSAPQDGQDRLRMKTKEKVRRSVAALVILGLLFLSSGILQTGHVRGLVTGPVSIFGAVAFEAPGCTGKTIGFSPLRGYKQVARDALAASNPRARSVQVATFCHNLHPSPGDRLPLERPKP